MTSILNDAGTGERGIGARTALIAGLNVLRDTQQRIHTDNVDALEGVEDLRNMALALFIETAELVQELDWKPWKKKSDVDLEKVAYEFADVLAFLGHILRHLERLGVNSSQISRAYALKSLSTLQKVRNGRANT